MIASYERHKTEIDKLCKTGRLMLVDLQRSRRKEVKSKSQDIEGAGEDRITFDDCYQPWYSEATALIGQTLPARLSEFIELYEGRSENGVSATTFTIRDWLRGFRSPESPRYPTLEDGTFDDLALTINRLKMQIGILDSAAARFQSSLFEIRQLTRAELFDSELDAAEELLKNGYLRAAGAIAGVVLENHLHEICNSHSLLVKKKNPTIGDFNDLLKQAEVINIPMWRLIQRLADLRNLCDHKKDRDPSSGDISELIDGAARVTRSVY